MKAQPPGWAFPLEALKNDRKVYTPPQLHLLERISVYTPGGGYERYGTGSCRASSRSASASLTRKKLPCFAYSGKCILSFTEVQ